MTRTTSLSAAIAIATAACVTLTLPEPAKACSPPPLGCTPPVRLFRPGDEVPASLIRFRVLVDDPGELTLRTKGGEVIAASIKTMGTDRVFSPDEEVAPEQELELAYTNVCPDNVIDPVTEGVFEFSTWLAEPVDLRAPELVVEERGIAYPGLPNNESVFVRLRYYSPDATASVFHLMDHHATVNGEPRQLTMRDGIPMLELRSRCEQPDELGIDSCGGVYSYPAGAYEVEVWSTIVGESGEPEHARLDIDLDCTTCNRGELGVDGSQGGAGSDPGEDGAQAGGGPAPDEAKASSGNGCAVAGVGSRTVASTPLMLALAAVCGALRRRRPAQRLR